MASPEFNIAMGKANAAILKAYEDYKVYVDAHNEHIIAKATRFPKLVDLTADKTATAYAVYLDSAEEARALQSKLIEIGDAEGIEAIEAKDLPT